MAAGMGAAMAQAAGPWGAPAAPPPMAPAAAPPPPPPPVAASWHVAENGATKGPFDEATLANMARAGQISRASMVWTAGQDGWKMASETPLARLFDSVPPPPPGA